MDSKTKRKLAAAATATATAASDEPPAKRMEAADLSAAVPDASSLKRKADKSAPGENKKKKEEDKKKNKQKKVKATDPAATHLAWSTSPEKAAGAVALEDAKSAPTDKAAHAKSSRLKKTAALEAAKPPPPEMVAASEAVKSPPPEKAAASKAANSAPPKKAAASKGTKSPPLEEPIDTPRPKKPEARKVVPATRPPMVPAEETRDITPPLQDIAPAKPEDVPEPQEEEYDKDENLEEKKLRYTYLWDKVVTAGEDRFPAFKKGFRNMDDAEAGFLNIKLRNMQMEKVKKGFQWDEINNQVTRALRDLI